MKVKNLNFVEKYIEKIILVVAVVFFVAVLVFKFIGKPYEVEMAGDNIAPDQIGQMLERKAGPLDKALKNPEPTIKVPKVPGYAGQHRVKLGQKLDGPAFLYTFGGPGLAEWVRYKQQQEEYFLPVPAAPSQPKTRQSYGVLASQMDAAERLKWDRRIGTAQPRDFRGVSVSAEFDLGAWRQLLGSEPPVPTMQLIPDEWVRNTLGIGDVVLECDEWDPQLGRWKDQPRTVALLPNSRIDYRSERIGWGPGEGSREVARIRNNLELIAQPLFAPLDIGQWRRPDVDLTPGQWDDYVRLEVWIQDQREKLRKAVQDGGAEEGGRDDRRNRGGAEEKTDIDRLQADLRSLIGQRNELLGKDAEALPELGPDDGAAGMNDIVMPIKVTVWGHDVDVRPGHSYRYRITVRVVNPLFQQPDLPEEQRKKFKDQLLLSSQASAWSQRVDVEPRTRFFLTRPNKVEVYYIFNGKRHVKEFTLQPGNRIGQSIMMNHDNQALRIDLSVAALVMDMGTVPSSLNTPSETTTRLTYWDEALRSVRSRTVEVDRDSLERQEMRDEMQDDAQR
jgi:hypothetical protein